MFIQTFEHHSIIKKYTSVSAMETDPHNVIKKKNFHKGYLMFQLLKGIECDNRAMISNRYIPKCSNNV